MDEDVYDTSVETEAKEDGVFRPIGMTIRLILKT